MKACSLHCLKIENISVAIGDNAILRDVSLHALRRAHAIIGKNGAANPLYWAILGEIRIPARYFQQARRLACGRA